VKSTTKRCKPKRNKLPTNLVKMTLPSIKRSVSAVRRLKPSLYVSIAAL